MITGAPVCVSHNRANGSLLLVRTDLPSCEKATVTSVCPANCWTSARVWASHSRAVPSALPVSTYLLSGEKVTAPTSSVWLLNADAAGGSATLHNSATSGPREYGLAVGGERDAVYLVGVAGEDAQWLSGGGIPQSDGAIVAAGEDRLAVGRKATLRTQHRYAL